MLRPRILLPALLAVAPLAWTACGGGAPAPSPEPPAQAAAPDAAALEAWNEEAVPLIEAGEYAKALALLQKVLTADPENVVALYNAACTYALQGDKVLIPK